MNNQSGQIELRDTVLMEELSLVDAFVHLLAKRLVNAQNLSENERSKEYDRLKKNGEALGRKLLPAIRPINEKYIGTYKVILSASEEIIKSLPESFYHPVPIQ